MSEKLFLLIAGVCCSILSIAPIAMELPFLVMLVLATIPVLACIPFMVSKKKD